MVSEVFETIILILNFSWQVWIHDFEGGGGVSGSSQRQAPKEKRYLLGIFQTEKQKKGPTPPAPEIKGQLRTQKGHSGAQVGGGGSTPRPSPVSAVAW